MQYHSIKNSAGFDQVGRPGEGGTQVDYFNTLFENMKNECIKLLKIAEKVLYLPNRKGQTRLSAEDTEL